MTIQELIQDLEKNVYCRLNRSSVEGIGVVAIRDIPKGTNIFTGVKKNRWKSIPVDAVLRNKKIIKEVKEMILSFYAVEAGVIYFPDQSLNELDISFYLNHSDTPNVEFVEKSDIFITARSIKKGEELFADYRTYSDEYMPSADANGIITREWHGMRNRKNREETARA
ncbi:MAG: Uncharacterized protein G01um101433_172 [Parcubacteria group bacterium Gr01-1014_33]|nr:MAG: Uncharacterized protein G01um101433_172 [Parcubacteria group bacterium Gr01-1014_33]